MPKFCSKCGKKLSDNDIFCSKCGEKVKEQDVELNENEIIEDRPEVKPIEKTVDESNQEKKKKPLQKLEYFLKAKERNEQEKIEIINKSILHEEQLSGLDTYPTENIKIKFTKDFDKFSKKTYTEFSLILITMVLLIALCFVMKYLKFNETAKVVVLLFLFLGIFACFSFIVERFYRITCIKYLKEKGKGIRKISYGKPPIMLVNGKLYTIECGVCLECGAKVHIEELDDKEVVVCDADRMHLSLLDTDELEKLAIEQNNNNA